MTGKVEVEISRVSRLPKEPLPVSQKSANAPILRCAVIVPKSTYRYEGQCEKIHRLTQYRGKLLCPIHLKKIKGE